MKMIRCILLLWAVLYILPAPAKENKDLVRARYYYTHFAYYEAIPYFEKVAGDLADPGVYAQLADCYSVTDNLEKAAAAYAKAVTNPTCSKAIVLRYGQLLMQLGRYPEAEKWLKDYQQAYAADRRGANLIAGCRAAQALPAAMPEGIATLLPFNTNGSDFGPAYWHGRLVFVSDTTIEVKKKTDQGSGKSFYNLYSIPCDGAGNCSGSMEKLSDNRKQNIKYHDGPCTFSADGNQMYFTRSTFNDHFFGKGAKEGKDSIVSLQVMIATDYDSVAKKFRTITPFACNSREYAVQHPSVSPNGKWLAFSSNMPKGLGGSDIYLCSNTGGQWSAPHNAGPRINTEGEEVFPFWADDRTLFFSSDGQVGLGGLDIYRCTWDEKSATFSTPENVGTPVNSSYDDISLAMHPNAGSTYFSSNRPATKAGDNIWFFKKEKIFLLLKVTDSLTGLPIASAGLTITAEIAKTDTLLGAAGSYFSRLYPERSYHFAIHKDGYFDAQLDVTATSAKETDTLVRLVKLRSTTPPQSPPVSRTPIDLSSVPHQVGIINVNIMDTPGVRTFELDKIYEIGHFYYDFNKYELTGAHKIFLDSLMAQLHRHPTLRIEIRAHTDCRGSFELNQTLSVNRALSVVNYLVKHGIPRSRLEYRGLGYSEPTILCPICDQCTEEQHNLNRILEFKVLQL